MVLASELRAGMALRIEGHVYKVLEAEAKAGTAKLGGVVKSKLRDVASGRLWEPHFRPDERLENLELARRSMEFLYAESGHSTTMRRSRIPVRVRIHSSVVSRSRSRSRLVTILSGTWCATAVILAFSKTQPPVPVRLRQRPASVQTRTGDGPAPRPASASGGLGFEGLRRDGRSGGL